MAKYERVIREDENGNQTVIGLLGKGETVKIVKDITPKQQAILNQKSELKKYCKELGGYIHICYVKNELLFNELNLNKATISRLVFLSTYIDYENREENVLVKRGTHNQVEYLTRKDLKKLLKLSDTTFKSFIKEAKEKELLFEANGKFYLSNKYFSKGKCLFNNCEYARIFIDTTRLLYSNIKTSQHKQLSYVFQLIPFLHYEANILCKNPDELDVDKLEVLSLKDICEILSLGTSKTTMNTFERNLLKFHIKIKDEEYYLFKRVIVKEYKGQTDFFIINPTIVWKGSDLDKKDEALSKLVFKF